jgi:hypothetical protein
LSIKTKLIGGISALTLAGGMLAVAGAPAGAVVTQIGSCQNLLALGSAKSSTINPATTKPYGIADVDNIDGSIGAKGVDPNVNKGTNLGSCSFPSNSTQGVPDSGKPVQVWSNGTHNLTKWSTKLFSREFDCDTTDTTDTTEWSPSGALSMTFADLNNLGKNQSITAQITVDGFTDPDSNPATPSDVVKFHGIVTKGAALGSDVTGETEFDPTVKDSSQTTATPYFGYNFDIGAALGCTTATKGDANIVTFNNGSVGGVSQLLGLPVAGIKFNKGVA